MEVGNTVNILNAIKSFHLEYVMWMSPLYINKEKEEGSFIEDVPTLQSALPWLLEEKPKSSV